MMKMDAAVSVVGDVGTSYSREEERRVVRRIDWVMMPIMVGNQPIDKEITYPLLAHFGWADVLG